MAEDYGYEGLYGRAIRALSGARDWYSDYTDPNRPRKRNAVDVNLPVAPPVEKPWYEKVTSPLEVAEQIGRKSVEPGKAQAKSIGGKLAGALGATQESGARAFGALMDATSTGSEKKPLSDVVWEGLKGVKSGYEAGLGATSASQEFMKRAPEDTLRGINPVQRAELGLGLDVVTDPTNLIPEKYLGAGAAALVGAGDVGQAWLPFKQWKAARNIEGLTHKLNDPSHEAAVLGTGFGVTSSEDVLGRMGHAGYYTPKEAKEARLAGKPPTGQSNASYTGGTPLPVSFKDETKILDVRGAPLPKEDFDVIIGSLDPVEDKEYIKTLTKAFNDQKKYAEGPGAIRHEDVRAGKSTPEQLRQYYNQLAQDPVATDAIERLHVLLVKPNEIGFGVKVKGSRGQAYSSGGNPKYGSAALNQPGMTGEYGGIHYTDYVVGGPQDTGYGKSGSMAFDPRQTLFAPVGSQKNPATTPWQQGKLAPPGTPKDSYGGGTFKGVMPSDAPGGVSSPYPGMGVEPPEPVSPWETAQGISPAQTAQEIAESWAAQNVETPKVYPPGGPSFMGKPISTYEQGTLKELEAAGRELDEVQKVKLDIIKQYESGVPPVEAPATSHWSTFGTSPDDPPTAANFADKLSGGGTYDEIIEAYNKLSTGGKEDFQDIYPDEYDHFQDIVAFRNPPTVSAVDPQTALYQPQTHRKMMEHVADLKSIWESNNIPPAWGNNLDEFFNSAVHPDLSPHDLHMAAADWVNQAGYPGAADEIKELWEIKLQGVPDEAPTNPSYAPENKTPVDYDTQYKEFIEHLNDTEADPEGIVSHWKNLHPALKTKLAHEDDLAFQTISELEAVSDNVASEAGNLDVAGMDFDSLIGGATRQPAAAPNLVKKPELLSALPEGFEGFDDVPEPATLSPMGKESIGVLDAEGSLDYLKNTYPEVAENFAKHSGTEMGSIESHTKDVLKQWKTQLSSEELADISSRYGPDVEAVLNTALPLHDIGKAQAIESGDKNLQHSFTIPIMEKILQDEGFDPNEVALARELFNHDMIGSLLQGSSKLTPQQVADELAAKAAKIGMDPSDFAKLQLAFFQADASSYPFVTQFMKQEPGGKWYSGSPKVKPIEDLIAGPGAAQVAKPVETTYTLKVPDAEDLLGGTKNKSIYTKNGQDYLFKEANPPYFADQEVSANKVANLAGLHPIKIETTQMGGKVGTMQAAVGNNMNWPTLKEVDLTTLTTEELRDIIRNHPVDWLTGNMDAHGAQFLRTPNGIVGIDRGRAFKNYAGNKLHEDFNPTGGVGYYDQIYNDIVRAYKKDELPQLTDKDIEAALDQTIFKMVQNQGAIMQEIYAGLERSAQGKLRPLADTRMGNLRNDLLKFWTGK
jgi:hypothetical protein